MRVNIWAAPGGLCKCSLSVCSDISVPLSSLCIVYPLQALVVHFEADTERRKLGLPHRVNFLGRSSLEPEYTQTEEVELHHQRHPVCTTAVFQLHVSNLWLLSAPCTVRCQHKLEP